MNTVRLGSLIVCEHEFPVRVVEVVSDAPAYHALFGDKLSPAYTSIDEAIAHADEEMHDVAWRPDLRPYDGEIPCPCCAAPMPHDPRYTRRLCVVCVLEAVDHEGRSLRFSNVPGTLGTGLVVTRDDGGKTQDGACFVRGVACRAEEAYFGGIVVEQVDART
jgi:hypothetical protein